MSSSLSSILFGSQSYHFNYANYGANRSLELVRHSLKCVTKTNNFTDFSDNSLSNPDSLFEQLKYVKPGYLILYFFGNLMERRDGKILFAHKHSNRKKSKSHIPLERFAESFPKDIKVFFFIDSIDVTIRNNYNFFDLENCVFIVRNYISISNRWRNGGEKLTGCLAETIEDLTRNIPQFSIEELLYMTSGKLNSVNIKDYFKILGEKNLLTNKLPTKNDEQNEIWNSDINNFQSLNSGSREDGIQNLFANNFKHEFRRNSKIIAEFFAFTDPDSNVRTAARQFLSDTDISEVIISDSYIDDNLIDTIDIQWAVIPKGEFIMGSNHNDDDFALPEEMPQHKVNLDSYEISRFTITNFLYNKFLKSIGNQDFSSLSDRKPITHISWYEAISFCNWLTFNLRRLSVIESNESITLPTEAEWEKAARGVSGNIYPWGNDFNPNACNYRDYGNSSVMEVGSFSPVGDSEFGLSDMAGNVWEWTLSLWGENGHKPLFGYPYNSEDGRENLYADRNVRRVVRGGSYYYFDYCVRSATRNLMYPMTKHSGGGFRVVKKILSTK